MKPSILLLSAALILGAGMSGTALAHSDRGHRGDYWYGNHHTERRYERRRHHHHRPRVYKRHYAPAHRHWRPRRHQDNWGIHLFFSGH